MSRRRGTGLTAVACLSMSCLLTACGSGNATHEAPDPSPSTDFRTYHDAVSGITLTVPAGYVIATTPLEAAARLPAVLGTNPDVPSKIADAQARLRKSTIMVAYHSPVGGAYDNVALTRTRTFGTAPANVQNQSFIKDARTSLAGVSAKNIRFTDTTLDGVAAEEATYSITPRSGAMINGAQFYAATSTALYVLTLTTGSAKDAVSGAQQISGSWRWS